MLVALVETVAILEHRPPSVKHRPITLSYNYRNLIGGRNKWLSNIHQAPQTVSLEAYGLINYQTCETFISVLNEPHICENKSASLYTLELSS